MDENENIVSAAESADGAESFSDDDFMAGFRDDGEFSPFAESGEETEEEASPEAETETPEGEETAENPEGEGEQTAESGSEGAASAPEMISFVEHGKKFSMPKEVVESFARATGRKVEDVIDIYQKGCGFDALNRRYEEAKADSEIFAKLANLRGITVEEAKNEVFAYAEKIPLDLMANQIRQENPGISQKTAEELAKFRIGAQKPKAEAPAAQQQDTEENEGRLRELDIFMANHPEVATLKNEILEAWKNSNVPLEEAYQNFKNAERVREKDEKIANLEAEIESLKKEKTKETQKAYAKEHSPGSAKTASGKVMQDEFIAGLFGEY